MTRFPNFRLGVWTLVALLAWDLSGWDLQLARMTGTPEGFPWRDDPFLVHVVHEGSRALSWALLIILFAAIRWPFGILRRLTGRGRTQLALTVLASVLTVSLFKQVSETSCPWDLKEFGGVARGMCRTGRGVSRTAGAADASRRVMPPRPSAIWGAISWGAISCCAGCRPARRRPGSAWR